MRERDLRRKYNLTPEQLEEQLSYQKYACAICHTKFVGDEYVIDHDHDKNCEHDPNVACDYCRREILCQNCNKMLGFAQDDPHRLKDAAEYVWRHKHPRTPSIHPDILKAADSLTKSLVVKTNEAIQAAILCPGVITPSEPIKKEN